MKKTSKWKDVAKKTKYTLALTIENDKFPCHTFVWSFCLYSYVGTDARQQLTSPRCSVQVQNLTLVGKVVFPLNEKRNFTYTSSIVKCAQTRLLKKP